MADLVWTGPSGDFTRHFPDTLLLTTSASPALAKRSANSRSVLSLPFEEMASISRSISLANDGIPGGRCSEHHPEGVWY